MNIIEKNVGPKIEYKVEGTKITFRDEMTLDLSKCERDYPVHLDICENRDRILVMGLSDYYVAQIDIPERQYDEEVVGEETVRTPVQFSMDRVTLTLWAIGGNN
ncbi:hypothetical protein TthWC1_2485 [Thermoanaerobacter thermohydrosulfuricus WC1]|uniref:Uncharacterized protein n=1 Tax=Thermoanaerobacter thermohydrosulfuricus WC1 TaxID=1198630 RepID=M8CUA3_THETY|nr:hypothetical protein [Thermoanaerobacter thermohydrosulfuricus]EMT38024.1 hypothetical protein TthWC1_2485 [Thermoanaerobacter thermohydrosulfuricus WC1]